MKLTKNQRLLSVQPVRGCTTAIYFATKYLKTKKNVS